MKRGYVWRRLIRGISQKRGLPSGTLVHVGEKKAEKVRITVIDYDGEQFQERQVETVEECLQFRDKPSVSWINVDGLHQISIIERLGECFGIHPLVLEDILHTGQRPKMEVFEGYIFVVLRMPSLNKEGRGFEDEQFSLVLGDNFVLSFQETEGDVFDPIRERLRKGKGRVRKAGADHLAYALIDAVVDSYFVVLERMGDEVEKLSDELVSDPTSQTLAGIQRLKREMIFLRRSVWPMREAVSVLGRTESDLIKQETSRYLRDVYDHAVQVIDTSETLRDMVSFMLETYFSSVNTRLNEIMKVLTIIASIFIPLTFITGLYGMNFQYMPELRWRWGYFGAVSIMLIIGVAMMLYFKRKKWF